MASPRKTYGKIRFDVMSQKWLISDTPPQVSLRIKDVFRRISKTAVGQFVFGNDPSQCFELSWFLDRYPMEISKSDRLLLGKGRRSFIERQDKLEAILSGKTSLTEVPGLADGCELWEYQRAAVEMFIQQKRMLLGDDIGLGKTNSAIGCMLTEGSLPCAVICEVHVADQWKERVEEFSNLKAHVVKSAGPYKLPEADVYIFAYSKIDGWADVVAYGAGLEPELERISWPRETEEEYALRLDLRRKELEKAGIHLPGKPGSGFFKFLVWDEPQSLRRGFTTEKGKAARVFVASVSKILGLTATPVMNYGIEMYNVMEFVAPGLLGTSDEFIREWCAGNDKVVADPDALGAYLREAGVLLRRTEEDVDRTLPQPNVLTHFVNYDQTIADENDDLAYTLAIRTRTGNFLERGSAFRQLDMLTRMTTGVAKAKGVADYTRILLEAGAPVLMAAWHREVYDVLLEELADWNPLLYTGTETAVRKRRNKEAFIAGDSNLLIMSHASGAGLDGLQHRCQDVVFAELDHSPMRMKQITGRLRRYGQPFVVNAHYLLANGGSDPVMVETLGLKASQAHGIMNPFEKPKASTHDTSRMQKIAEMVIEKRKRRLAEQADVLPIAV